MAAGNHRDGEPAPVLILGLDGATWDLLDPLLAAGRLPNIARLLAAGSRGPLLSTVPPMTFPAWTTLMTGVNPGKHGIFDFTQRKARSYDVEFTNAAARGAPTMWRLLSDCGKRVACVRIPVTYPPEPLNGVTVCGFEALGMAGGFTRKAVYPPEIFDAIKREVPGYHMKTNATELAAAGRIEAIVDHLLEGIDLNLSLCEYLFQREDWDCFMVVFGESDLAGHFLWRYHDEQSPRRLGEPSPKLRAGMTAVYEALDRAVGRLSDLAPAHIRLLVSDHGFGGVSDWVIQMNTWLAEAGFLAFKGGSGDGHPAGGRGPLMNALDAVRTTGMKLLPPAVKAQLYKHGEAVVNRVESYLRFGNLDLARTQVYAEEVPYGPSLWVNLRGREPAGTVAPGEEYEAIRDRVIARLSEWRHPETGAALVASVRRREDVYHGDYVSKAPDLIVEWALNDGYSYAFEKSGKGGRHAALRRLSREELDAPAMHNKSGFHRPEGILGIAGPGIAAGAQLQGARLLDIAPTVMHLLGLPVPAHMDGGPLLQALSETAAAARRAVAVSQMTAAAEVVAEADYSEDEEQAIQERLESLGYIE